jgi:hypothetical protein
MKNVSRAGSALIIRTNYEQKHKKVTLENFNASGRIILKMISNFIFVRAGINWLKMDSNDGFL